MRTYNSKYLERLRRQLRFNATLPERLLWNELRHRSFGYKFRRQHSVGRYILDFYCPALKLAIEVDGAYHYEPKQRAYDRRRTRYLESLGLKVIRYPAVEVLKNLAGVAEDISYRCHTSSVSPSRREGEDHERLVPNTKLYQSPSPLATRGEDR